METSLAPTDLAALLAAVRAFVDTELLPLETTPDQHFPALLPILAEKRAAVKANEWWTPHLPQAWGGLGLSLHEFGQLSEVLGRSPFGHYCFNAQAPDVGNMEILIEHGTPAQQEQWLWPLLRGEIRSCFAMTEPEHAGSNPLLMSTTAQRDGDAYILNGHKWFTTAADGATFAIIMAVTHPDADHPYQRASQLIVPTNTPGFVHVRNLPVMGEAGAGYFSHAEIRLENCHVPATNLLGQAGHGFAIAQERLGPGRIHHCMRWIGICERAFEMMCRRATHRKIAADKTLADQQTIQHWIAECRAEINAARLLVLDTAHKIDTAGAYAARTDISIIKFYVANVLQTVLDRAIQVHGALGMTDDLVLAHWYRHERGARIYDGADEVHKSRVARQILKAYR